MFIRFFFVPVSVAEFRKPFDKKSILQIPVLHIMIVSSTLIKFDRFISS